MSGSQFDRLVGLEPLSVICPGRSVLDVGCHRGLISYEAARFGAALVHGIDLYPQGIEAAREIFKDTGIPNQFVEFDLSLGRDAIAGSLGGMLLPRYDIVLMLAVLQHLRRQMESGALDDLFDFFVERAATYLVLRMPNIEWAHQRLAKRGFRRAYLNEIDEKLAPVAIYQR
jgi:SAM-dependent methyltransferase